MWLIMLPNYRWSCYSVIIIIRSSDLAIKRNVTKTNIQHLRVGEIEYGRVWDPEDTASGATCSLCSFPIVAIMGFIRVEFF